MKNFEFIRPANKECMYQASKNLAQLYFSYLGDETKRDISLVLAETDIGVFVLWAELLANNSMNFLPAFVDDLPETNNISQVTRVSYIHKNFSFSYHNKVYFFDGERIFSVLIINSQSLLETYTRSLGWSDNNIFAFTKIYVQGLFRHFLTYAWRIVNWDTDDYCIVPAFSCAPELFELPFKNNGINFMFECEDILIGEFFMCKKSFWQLKNSAEQGLFIEPIGLDFSTDNIIC